jgi:signal transduction histidine kinase
MRIRLTLWVVALFSVIQWSVSGVLWRYQSASNQRVLDERLLGRAEALVSEVAKMVPGTDRAWFESTAARHRSFVHNDTLVIELFDRDGRPAISGGGQRFSASDVPLKAVLASDDAVFMKLREHVDSESVSRSETGSGTSSGTGMRAVAIVILGSDLEPYVLVVGTADSFGQAQLALVGRLFLLSAMLGPLVTTACGWFIAGIAVKPFERLGHLASELGPESLNHSLCLLVRNTEMAELRDQLEEARVRIRDAFQMQERFLTNVSHELKTPIAVVLTEAQTLRSVGMSAEVMEFVESTEEEMQRLGRLVESFLTLARVRDGHHEPRGKRYGVNDLAMDAVEHCAKMADLHGVVLAAELLEDDQALEASVSGDPELLRTMLDNLIRNAIRFTPPGKLVDVRMEIQGGWLHVRVVDQGPGIPCDQMRAVFDRFRQGSNQQNGRAGGHGLGLAIAQGIAELHGGRIGVLDGEGGGCVFEVRLPLSGRGVHANGRGRGAAPG